MARPFNIKRKIYRKKVGKYRRKRNRVFRSSRTNGVRRPHRFTRWLDWSDVYLLQGGSFSGTFGMSANLSTGLTAAFIGTALQITVPASSTGWFSCAMSPVFGAMPDYNEFTRLFDMYRVTSYGLKIVNLQNDYQAGTVTTGGTTQGFLMPTIHMCVDLDDNVPPAATAGGVNELRQYTTYRYKMMNGMNYLNGFVRLPGVKVITDSSQTGTGLTAVGMVKRSPKLDCAYDQIQSHGLKWVIEMVNNSPTTAATYWFKLETKIFITMYEVR